MSRDGLLPDNVREGDPDAPWNAKGHARGCPLDEDTGPLCDCGCRKALHVRHADGTLGGCLGFTGRVIRRVGYVVCSCRAYLEVEPACKCEDIAADAEAEAADAAEARAEERRWNP